VVPYQSLQGLHKIREQCKHARVARICEARALLAEFGISTPAGVRDIGRKLTLATEQAPMLIQYRPRWSAESLEFIQAPLAATVAGDKQENKTEKHSRFSMINGREKFRPNLKAPMELKVSHGHRATG
jgi:hypothetical protein